MADCKGKSLKELRELAGSTSATINELRELNDTEGREWSGEDETAWQAANADYNQIERSIRAAEVDAKRFKPAPNDGPEHHIDPVFGPKRCTEEDRCVGLQSWMRTQSGLDITNDQREACQRVGVNPNSREFRIRTRPMSPEPVWVGRSGNTRESRYMSVGTNAEGGFTVPEGFQAELERTLLAFGGVRRVARILRTDSGNDMPLPTEDDTGNTGAILAENTTFGASVEATFAAVTFNAYKYSSTPVIVSQELLDDSAFNLAPVIAGQVGTRIGRITNTHFTTGDASSKPNGVVTASGLGVTTAGAAAITFDEVFDLYHSVDPAYRSAPGFGWMMNDGILVYIRKLKDSNNNYLWSEGLTASEPNTLLGKPYTINQDMQATVATATKTMLVGDFSKYIIRDVADMRMYRLDERYRDLDQTAFVAFSRHDGDCINTGAIKHMLQA